MRRLLLVVGIVLAVGAPAMTARASSPPLPEPNFAGTVVPSPCAAQSGDPYEAARFAQEGWAGPDYVRYPGACQRLHFVYGPIVVKPGQNDVLVTPVTIEKPAYDGYVTRFAPNLVGPDGKPPDITDVHLHHATWLTTNNYGEGPFFAAGEEKTIGDVPRGYGMPVKGSDVWALLYMIHDLSAQPKVVWITYDLDYIAKDKAESYPINLKPAYPVWLDVRNGSAYPVFNAVRGYGTNGSCTWPAQECAPLDPWGNQSAGQGKPPDRPGGDVRLPQRGSSMGRMTNFQGGTLIEIGGHLHPGGTDDAVDLVRGGQSRRIFTSESRYWDHVDHSQLGAPPTSWDFSMTTTGLPTWGIHVLPGDVLRINATYDSTVASTYEDMGIAIAMMAPDTPSGRPNAPGLDPFTVGFDPTEGCSSGGLAAGVVCDKGVVTHGHLPEASTYGGPVGTITTKAGSQTNQVDISGFTYVPGDLSTIGTTGVPVTRLGQQLTFVNTDAAADVYHTVTTCAYPCAGATGLAFPLANGDTSAGRPLDFDSAQLGYGLPIGGASNRSSWTLDVTGANGFRKGETVTFFCRIHPYMRGAFQVG